MARQPNILFLLSDEHSFRFFGHLSRAEGGEEVATPALDRLAARAAVFANTYTPVPLCVPSRICFLSGLEAQRSGAWDNDSILDPRHDTVAKALGRAGYATCLVGKMHFRGNLQFHGFQHRPYGDLTGNAAHQYEHAIPTGSTANGDSGCKSSVVGDDVAARTRGAGTTRIPESLVVDQVIALETLAFLREQQAREPGRPWFLTASFSRPHFPLTAPPRHLRRHPVERVSEPFVPAAGDSFDHPVSAAIREGFQVGRIDHAEMMGARAGYFGAVAYLDEILGDLLLRLEVAGLLEDTIVVYASDHGEMAGEHGTWWKSGWYEACTRVPLMVSLPAHRQGDLAPSRSATPVTLLDLHPTFAGFAGVEATGGSGIDLGPVIRSGAEPPSRPIVSDHLNPRWGAGSEFRAVRLGNHKLVRFDRFEPLLFDLASDPGEQRNLFERAEGEAREARDHLIAFVADTLDFATITARRSESEQRLHRQHGLDSSAYLPNQYQLASGRVIEADATLYRPEVITADPASFFADWPGRAGSD